MVEGRQLVLAQPFDDGDDGGVYEAKVQVGVPAEQLANPNVVVPHQIDDCDRAVLQVGQKRCEGLGAEPAACQPVELDDHRRGNQQLLVRSAEEFCAGPTICIP